jgi:hypothetical protein
MPVVEVDLGEGWCLEAAVARKILGVLHVQGLAPGVARNANQILCSPGVNASQVSRYCMFDGYWGTSPHRTFSYSVALL